MEFLFPFHSLWGVCVCVCTYVHVYVSVHTSLVPFHQQRIQALDVIK